METRTWLPEVIVQLIDRVEERLEEPWSLDGMADEARFSSFHFHRMFQERPERLRRPLSSACDSSGRR